jgi:hypothetical protein
MSDFAKNQYLGRYKASRLRHRRKAPMERAKMTMDMSRGSAQIFEFPRRGRFAVAGHLDDNNSAANFASPRVASTVCGSAWYHDEAIQALERPLKN